MVPEHYQFNLPREFQYVMREVSGPLPSFGTLPVKHRKARKNISKCVSDPVKIFHVSGEPCVTYDIKR